MPRARYIIVLMFFIVGVLPAGAAPSEKRNRIEELYIWKMSEDLKLSIQEEKSFSDLVRSLNQRRITANQKISDITRSLQSEKSPAKVEQLLNQYQKALDEYAAVSSDEIQSMRKILGSNKAAQYLVVKSDLNERLKTLLASPSDKQPERALPRPRVIED